MADRARDISQATAEPEARVRRFEQDAIPSPESSGGRRQELATIAVAMGVVALSG
jgi:hypothetical protein